MINWTIFVENNIALIIFEGVRGFNHESKFY